MENRKLWIKLIMIPLLLIITVTNPIVGQVEGFEWKVNVGDRKTFTYTKYYLLDNSDGDNNPSIHTGIVINNDGEQVNVTFQKGTKFQIEIIELHEAAKIQETLGGEKLKPTFSDLFVLPTTTNKSYWEERARAYDEVTDHNTSLDGDEFTEATIFWYSMLGIELWTIKTHNWKTGWLITAYTRQSSKTTILSESEIQAESGSGINGFEGFPLVLGIIPLIYMMRKWRKVPS